MAKMANLDFQINRLPVYEFDVELEKVLENDYNLLQIIESYFNEPAVTKHGAFFLKMPEQKIPSNLLNKFLDTPIGEHKVSKFVDESGSFWDLEDIQDKIEKKETYRTYKPKLTIPDFELDSRGISNLFNSLPGHKLYSSFRNPRTLTTPTMLSAQSLKNPLNHDAEGIRYIPTSWPAHQGIAIADLMVSLGPTFTGFHVEDRGFCSFGVHLFGGRKIWLTIDPNPDNIKLLMDEIQNRLITAGKEACPGIINNRALFLTPTELEKLGVSFAIGVQTPGMIAVTGPNLIHAVETQPAKTGPAVTIMSSVNFVRAHSCMIDAMENNSKWFNCTCEDLVDDDVGKPTSKSKKRKSKKQRTKDEKSEQVRDIPKHGSNLEHAFSTEEVAKAIHKCIYYISKNRALDLDDGFDERWGLGNKADLSSDDASLYDLPTGSVERATYQVDASKTMPGNSRRSTLSVCKNPTSLHSEVNVKTRLKCPTCPGTFKDKNSVKLHVLKKHGDNPIKKGCPFSGCSYQGTHVMRHYTRNHNKVGPNVDNIMQQ